MRPGTWVATPATAAVATDGSRSRTSACIAGIAIALPIPPLPNGWEGKPDEHVRCKNFQFAVAYFGYPKEQE